MSAQEVRKEMQAVASVGHDSILRMKNKESLEHFSWDRVWCVVQTHCPLLAKFLKECLPPSAREKDSFIPSLCLCSSILLKLRNPHINLVQTGHANNQVRN